MGKFIMGVLFGVPAGAMLIGTGLVTIWKDGRWVEWAEKTDRNLSVRLGQPRQMGVKSSVDINTRGITVDDIFKGRGYRY